LIELPKFGWELRASVCSLPDSNRLQQKLSQLLRLDHHGVVA
jgi:hypothetical protein